MAVEVAVSNFVLLDAMGAVVLTALGAMVFVLAVILPALGLVLVAQALALVPA